MNFKVKRNKIIKRLIFVAVIICISTLAGYSQKKASAEEGKVTNYDDAISILEIEPGNVFNLQEGTIDNVSGVDLNGKKVKVTHINMPEFISKVDEINGQYDIVVIGRANAGLANSYSNDKVYRDYTNPFTQKMNELRYTVTGEVYNQMSNPRTIGGKTYVEYCSENDITNKRASDILKMIDLGQLVYIDNSIFDIKAGNEISKTNLFKLFSSKNASNLQKCNSNDINLKNIISKYQSIQNDFKRPVVTKLVNPSDDTNRTTANTDRNMKFKLSINEPKQEKLKIKLYLDIDADGLFKDKELVKTYEFETQVGTQDYEISYILNKNFVGYLDWKIEISKENGVKTNIVSNSLFKSLIGARKIRVLQIHPLTKDDANKLYLDKNPSAKNGVFNQLIASQDVRSYYDLDITAMSCAAFNNGVKNKTISLNGNYDMVIIGFADNYGNTNDFVPEAINELDSFIKTGQSVMFTHDTITFDVLNDFTLNRGPKKLAQHFRDYVGQSRFKDPLRMNNGQIDESDIYKNYVVSRDAYGNMTDVSLQDKKIVHEQLSAQDKYNYSLGTPLKSMQWSQTLSTTVRKINDAQIDKFPFGISATPTINVAQTHTQWFQLNLEDPDVVPWYNLSRNDLNDGDSRNFYYTYSRGNITYSGTGHSEGYTNDEFKLFINTIVKAERGANHAPQIESTIPDAGEEISIDDDYKFNTTATDLDNDRVTVKVSLCDQNGGFIQYINLDGQNASKTINQGDPIDVVIPKSLYQDKLGQSIKVKINAKDIQGAEANKVYTLVPTKVPQVRVNISGNKGLVGDSINVKLNLTKENDTNNKISNVTMELGQYNENLFDINNFDNNSIPFQNTNADKTFSVKANSETNGDIINAKLKYSIASKLVEKDIKIPIYSKLGKISVNIQNDYGESMIYNNSQLQIDNHVWNENISVNSATYSWPNSSQNKVISALYNMSFNLPNGVADLSNKSCIITQGGSTITSNNPKAATVNINYDNPEAQIVFIVKDLKAKNKPDVLVSLDSPVKDSVVEPNGTIDVQYTISPQSFDFRKNTNKEDVIDEAIFVVDLSSQINEGNRWPQIKSRVVDNLLRGNILNGKNIKLGVIGYNDTIKYVGTDSQNKRLFNINDSQDNEKFRMFFQDDSNLTSKIGGTPNRNIVPALQKADEIFTKDGDIKDSKAIVLISSGSVNYSQADIESIRNRGYKIINLDMSSDDKGVTNSNLKQLQSDLLGQDKDLFVSRNDGGNFNFVNIDMDNISTDLLNGMNPESYCFNDLEMNFDLGSNFDLVDNSINGTIGGKSSVINNRLNVKLAPIYYKVGSYNGDGTYKHVPLLDNIKVNFKVKPKSDKYGKLGFNLPQDNTHNNMSYTLLNGSQLQNLIETPEVMVRFPITITHGVYGGIDLKTKTPVIDTTDRTFNKSATVPMAASFEFYKGTTVKLDLDTNVQMVGTPIIYKVNADGTLTKIGTMDSNNSAQIGDGLVQGDKVLVLYNIKLPENEGAYTNSIKVEDVAQPATIKVGKDGLPDLF